MPLRSRIPVELLVNIILRCALAMKVFVITFTDGSEQSVTASDYHQDGDEYLFRGENGNVHRFRADQVRSILETEASDWKTRGGGSY